MASWRKRSGPGPAAAQPQARPIRLRPEPPPAEPDRPRRAVPRLHPAESGAEPAQDFPRLLARLPTSGAALLYWAHLRGILQDSGESGSARCMRASDGAYWVQARISADAGAAIIWMAGGDAYTSTEAGIRPVTAPGVPLPGRASPSASELASWRQLAILELVAATTPAQVLEPAATAVGVLTSGRLAHLIVGTSVAAGADVTYQSVLRRPLFADGAAEPAVLLDITCSDPLPGSLVRILAGLPYTVVGRYADEQGSLLLDVGFRLPVSDSDVAAEVAPGERWVIGRSGAGCWSVQSIGAPSAAGDLLTAPDLPAISVPAEPDPCHVRIEPARVRLVPSQRHAGRIDAVLLDEGDLGRLRSFLAGRPLAEQAFLVPGPGCYLLSEPAGLRAAVPMGLPLRRIGPGGLYVADGHTLYPALPPTARASLFSVTRGRLVVVCPGATVEFGTDDAFPAWSLWLADAVPECATGVSAAGRELLARMERVLDGAAVPVPWSWTDTDARQRAELRRTAFVLEQDGDAMGAAELLEQAGDFARAAWVLEQAAAGEASRDGS